MADYTKTDPDTTSKLPPNPDATVRSTIEYPYIAGSFGFYGEQNITSQFGSINTAFVQSTDITSGYHIRENTQSGNSVIHDFKNAHEFAYGSGGSSKHNDGNQASSTKGQTHNVTVGSRGIETGKDTHDGNGGSKVEGTGGDGQFENHTGGNKFVTTSGDIVSQHDGNRHTSVNGDVVEAVVGNKYNTVNGEHGLFVQNGNFDIQISDGQMRIAVSSNLTIISNTSISFVCGCSSITMTPTSISIISGASGNGILIESNMANTTILANGGSQYVVNVQPPMPYPTSPGAPAPYTTFTD